jgi:hypothetical protein
MSKSKKVGFLDFLLDYWLDFVGTEKIQSNPIIQQKIRKSNFLGF